MFLLTNINAFYKYKQISIFDGGNTLQLSWDGGKIKMKRL